MSWEALLQGDLFRRDVSTTPTLPNIDEIANHSNIVLVANLVLAIVRELTYFLNTNN